MKLAGKDSLSEDQKCTLGKRFDNILLAAGPGLPASIRILAPTWCDVCNATWRWGALREPWRRPVVLQKNRLPTRPIRCVCGTPWQHVYIANIFKELGLIKTYARLQAGGIIRAFPFVNVNIWHYGAATPTVLMKLRTKEEIATRLREPVPIAWAAGRIESGYPVWQNDSENLMSQCQGIVSDLSCG